MKLLAKSITEPTVSPKDFVFFDSRLHSSLDGDPYLTQQYIEATQIITDLHEHLGDFEDDSAGDASTIDMWQLINGFTLRNRAQLDAAAADQQCSAYSSDRLVADLEKMLGIVDEIYHLLVRAGFGDREK